MPAFPRTDRPNGPRLVLHCPETESRFRAPAASEAGMRDVVYWRVNGYRAAMLVWTDDEFARLAPRERPRDAQHFSCGIWAVLRMV